MSFRDYRPVAYEYITIIDSEFYPDYLDVAKIIYQDTLDDFREIVFSCSTSVEVFKEINKQTGKDRIQLLRVFRKYISPDTSVEMLKVKKKESNIISAYGDRFRELDKVKTLIYKEDEADMALIALLYEYQDRGQKGYDLTELFFEWFEAEFENMYKIEGPRSAGKDVILSDVLPDYMDKTPADFVISDINTDEIKVIGFARYDSDRGGAQEDDRTSGNRDKITLIDRYAKEKDHPLKLLFLNDGPGLLLGSMWEDYAQIEELGEGSVMVATIKMLEERFTQEWIETAPDDTTL